MDTRLDPEQQDAVVIGILPVFDHRWQCFWTTQVEICAVWFSIRRVDVVNMLEGLRVMSRGVDSY